jgi:hypothetical protein
MHQFVGLGVELVQIGDDIFNADGNEDLKSCLAPISRISRHSRTSFP